MKACGYVWGQMNSKLFFCSCPTTSLLDFSSHTLYSGFPSMKPIERGLILILIPSLKLTAKAPENGWLEDDPFHLGWPISGALAVSFREGTQLPGVKTHIIPSNLTSQDYITVKESRCLDARLADRLAKVPF